MTKVRYIETFPDKIQIILESGDEYNNYIRQRVDDIYEKLDLGNPKSKYNYTDWKHKTVTLNKDGTVRKYFNPIHLQSPEVRKLQEEKFKEYQEKKRKEWEMKREQSKQLDKDTYDKAIKVLLENRVDLNRLDIRVKR